MSIPWPPSRERGVGRCSQRRSGQRGPRRPGPEHSCPLAASMVPQRKSDFSQIVLRALFTGACVSLMNACVAGESLAWQSPDFLLGWALGLWTLRKSLEVGSEGIEPAHHLLFLRRDPLCAQGGRGQLYKPPEHDPQQHQL